MSNLVPSNELESFMTLGFHIHVHTTKFQQVVLCKYSIRPSSIMQKREKRGMKLKKKEREKVCEKKEKKKYHAFFRIKKGNTKAYSAITFRHTCT